MTVEVRKVMCRRDMDDFVRLPRNLYKGVPQYVPDMDTDIRKMFSNETNPGLNFSNIQPFVAYKGHEPVGRIAGIVNRRANEKWKQKVVRFGMVEFIDDPQVSKMLVEAVELWGHSLGMDTLQGPMGITDFDKEGMLVEDFHLTGTINTIWNPEYYPRHMESLGFEKAVDWLQIRIDIPQEVPAKYSRVSQYVREQMGLRVVTLSSDDIDKRGYGRKIFNLLNEAYAPIFGFSALSDKQIDDFVEKYLKLIDLKLVPVIVDPNGELVGVAITMGSLSKATQKTGGRLWPFGWYHMLKALKWKHEENAEMLLIAVRPDYQGMGVNAMFFDTLIPIYNKYGFKWAETGPQLEYNVRELSQWKPLKPEFVKRRRCYTKKI